MTDTDNETPASEPPVGLDTAAKSNTAAAVPAPSPGVRPKLHTVGSVRREAARVYRRYLTGHLSAADLSRVIAALGTLCIMIRDGELERRVAELESGREPWRRG